MTKVKIVQVASVSITTFYYNLNREIAVVDREKNPPSTEFQNLLEKFTDWWVGEVTNCLSKLYTSAYASEQANTICDLHKNIFHQNILLVMVGRLFHFFFSLFIILFIILTKKTTTIIITIEYIHL